MAGNFSQINSPTRFGGKLWSNLIRPQGLRLVAAAIGCFLAADLCKARRIESRNRKLLSLCYDVVLSYSLSDGDGEESVVDTEKRCSSNGVRLCGAN
jgi:hypothetical protein